MSTMTTSPIVFALLNKFICEERTFVPGKYELGSHCCRPEDIVMVFSGFKGMFTFIQKNQFLLLKVQKNDKKNYK